MQALLFSLGSNVSFAFASFYFTEYSRRVGPVWMNFVKSIIAFTCFSAVILLFSNGFSMSTQSLVLFGLSGVVGLLFGDIFLLHAFKDLGSGRVLMIFGFQPLFLGIASYFLFNEDYSFTKIVAIIFLMLCLFSFSYESFREKGHWDIKGLVFAILGIGLDGVGLLLTKMSFNLSPAVTVFEANFVRSGSTVLGFMLIYRFFKKEQSIKAGFKMLNSKDRFLVVLCSVLGTFVSLALYLKAVQIGSLPTISALAGTSPLLATLLEIVLGRKKMTLSLAVATISFLAGLSILIFL